MKHLTIPIQSRFRRTSQDLLPALERPLVQRLRFIAGVLAVAVMLGGVSPDPAALAQTPPAASAALSEATVKALQEALTRQGIAVKADGVLTDETRAGIRKYQSQHHLPVTGEPDAATLGKLGVRPSAAAAPSPTLAQAAPAAPPADSPPAQAAPTPPAPQTPMQPGQMPGGMMQPGQGGMMMNCPMMQGMVQGPMQGMMQNQMMQMMQGMMQMMQTMQAQMQMMQGQMQMMQGRASGQSAPGQAQPGQMQPGQMQPGQMQPGTR
jgi:hypothetical protein